MIPQATVDKMRSLKLYGMANAYHAAMDKNFTENFTVDEFVAHLIDSEWEERYNRKLSRYLKAAKFRHQCCMEQIDYHFKRNLDKNLILRLSNSHWVEKHENILITGPTGVGKSFLACALGHQACINGFKTLYFNASKLFSRLKFAKADGTYIKELAKIQKQNILIIDDFGLHPMDEQSKLILLELLEDRYNIQSTIITSQFSPKDWHEIIASSTIADAICDRLMHNSYKIELEGDSMRKILNKHSG